MDDPKPGEPNATISINVDALHRAFTWRTLVTLEQAALLIEASVASVAVPEILPHVPGPVIPPSLLRRPLGEVRDGAVAWVIAGALRDVVEEVATFLEEVRRLCAVIDLGHSRVFSGEEFERCVVQAPARFATGGLPDRVAFLRKTYGSEILDHRIDDVLTLNSARNCLVHREGVVGPKDVGERDALVVRWQPVEVWFRGQDGEEIPVTIGMRTPSPGQLVAKVTPVERRFELGARVTFSTSDLSGIWLTLNLFSHGTARRVTAFAESRGFDMSGGGNGCV